ncbi:MAG: chorismate synthase [Synergistetes bacterium]|nr:chorismate synthase [Synergistota bacterium]
MLRIITAGESHGSKIIGILDGMPAGLRIDLNYLREFLKRRRGGYGRGRRMDIETDELTIHGGVHKGITTGAPLLIEIQNRGDNPVKRRRTVPRPGHADYVGYLKYALEDLNIPAERASARETAVRTALGAICSLALRCLDIEIVAFTRSIGSVCLKKSYSEIENLREKSLHSPVYCPDDETTELMLNEIDRAKAKGETLGGSFTVIAKNVPHGLGSYSQWDRRLDSHLGFCLLSIPSVKAVEIGNAIEGSKEYGSQFQDGFKIESGKIKRTSNHAGGIEGGVSNGEDIIVTAYLKPVPTALSIRKSIDIETLQEATLEYIRSDTVVVPAASVIGEAMVSFCILRFILEKFGGDTIPELKERVKSWRGR